MEDEFLIHGQIHQRRSTETQKQLLSFNNLESCGELEGEIRLFCLLYFSVSICYAYLSHKVLRDSLISQLLLIANFGGCFESTWRQFWGGLTGEKKETLREFQPTSMTSYEGGFIQDSDLHSLVAKDEVHKELIYGVSEDILDGVIFEDNQKGEFTVLPASVDTPILATPAARPPQTRSETRVHRPPLLLAASKDVHVKILPQRQPRQGRAHNPRCGEILQLARTMGRKESQPPLAPRLQIGEQRVDTTNVVVRSKEKRKYHKRQSKVGEASNSLAPSRRRAVGCPGTRRAVGQLVASTLLSYGFSDCSDKAYPRPSIFFTPPKTRSKCFARSCGDWGRISRNLFPDGQPAIEGSQSIVPQKRSCLLKIAFINMNWGGEVLENPCGFAFGRVLHSVEGSDGEDHLLRCDFGGDFGIQNVTQQHCEFLPCQTCGGDIGDNYYGGDDINMASVGDSTKPELQNLPSSLFHPGAQGMQTDCSSEDDWQPNIDDLCSAGDGYSDGDSFNGIFPEDEPIVLLRELGMYGDGPREGDEELLSKYNDVHWHAKI